ncbi:MAG: hypothetical protein QOH12_95, partial [Solirubrobacteraceae bacterium]|nr:hypothetical protein [Solirubrobacteraceae bacterium]
MQGSQDEVAVGEDEEISRSAERGSNSALPVESAHPLEAVRGAATAFSDILS